MAHDERVKKAPLIHYDTEDLLHDYLMLAQDFPQDDKDVISFREILEARGFTFVTYEIEYDLPSTGWVWNPHLGKHVAFDRDESLTNWERNV